MDIIGALVSLIVTFSLLGFVILIIVGIYALTCIGRMRMFQKAGENGWKAWVPFYRDYVLCRITMGAGWYFIFGWIPVLSFFMNAIYALEVTLSYGQSVLYGVLYFFLPTIAELVAGFGGAQYIGSQDLERQVRDMFSGGGSTGKYHDIHRDEPDMHKDEPKDTGSSENDHSDLFSGGNNTAGEV